MMNRINRSTRNIILRQKLCDIHHLFVIARQICVYDGQNMCYNSHEMISGTVSIVVVILEGMITASAKKRHNGLYIGQNMTYNRNGPTKE